MTRLVIFPLRYPAFSPVLSAILTIALWCGLGWGSDRAWASEPDTAPPELKMLLENIETEANRQNLEALMRFYAPDFENTDGLNHDTLKRGLRHFWEQYYSLNYRTTLQDWERDGNAIIATTVTEIEGVKRFPDRDVILRSRITSQQRIENDLIIAQEILAERNQLTSGDAPPTVTLNIPEQVFTGREFSLDAIVEEPLGSELLIGGAIVQPVNTRAYFEPTPVSIQFLTSGGIFKIGQAPILPEDNWVSTILMRRDGITSITQRMRVVD